MSVQQQHDVGSQTSAQLRKCAVAVVVWLIVSMAALHVAVSLSASLDQ